jgi:hypothetical protein
MVRVCHGRRIIVVISSVKKCNRSFVQSSQMHFSSSRLQSTARSSKQMPIHLIKISLSPHVVKMGGRADQRSPFADGQELGEERIRSIDLFATPPLAAIGTNPQLVYSTVRPTKTMTPEAPISFPLLVFLSYVFLLVTHRRPLRPIPTKYPRFSNPNRPGPRRVQVHDRPHQWRRQNRQFVLAWLSI